MYFKKGYDILFINSVTSNIQKVMKGCFRMRKNFFRKRMAKSLAVILTSSLAVTNVNMTAFAAGSYGVEDTVKDGGTESSDTKGQESTSYVSEDLKQQSKLDKLQERINALPEVSEFISMADGVSAKSGEFTQEQKEIYDEVQKISDEYDELSGEEQAQVDTIRLENLFEYWNSQTKNSNQSGDGWSLTDGELTIDKKEVLESDSAEWISNSSEITSVEINCEPAKIGARKFSGCSNLTEIDFLDDKESIKSIGDGAFSGCSSLTEINIPENITYMGYGVFEGCTNLTTVELSAQLTIIDFMTFSGCSKLAGIELSDSIKTIGNRAFSGCSSLNSITLPEGLTGINYKAFEDCNSLTGIELPENLKNIDSGAFSGCGSLTEITLPDNITSISSDTFSGCSNLANIVMPDELTSIESNAFNGCSKLAQITLPDSLTSIGSGAFSNCSSLTDIFIPEDVAAIDKAAFSGCSSLNNLYILGNPEIDSDSSTLGGTVQRKVTVYYFDDEDGENTDGENEDGQDADGVNADKYVNTVNPSCYVRGENAVLKFKETEKTQDFNSGSVEFTADFSGMLSLMEEPEFDVNIDDEYLEVSDEYNADKKQLTLTVTPKKSGVYDVPVTIDINGQLKSKQISGYNIFNDNLKLTVRKKVKADVQIEQAKTISNAGGNVNLTIPSPDAESATGYDTSKSLEVLAENAAFSGIIDESAKASYSITDNGDGTSTLSLQTNRVAEECKKQSGVIKVKIPVEATDNYEDYYMILTLNIKNSPDFSISSLVNTSESITFDNNDLSCEYSLHGLNEEAAADSWSSGSKITFEKLSPATFYVIDVRYKAADGVGATLSDTMLVNTLTKKPSEKEGYEISYRNETIKLTSDRYEIKKQGETDEHYSSDTEPADIKPGEIYEIRLRGNSNGTTVIQPSDTAVITIPSRAEAPAAVKTLSGENVTESMITTDDTHQGLEYIVAAGDFTDNDIDLAWKYAARNNMTKAVSSDGESLQFMTAFKKDGNGRLVSDKLAENTKYRILVRKTSDESGEKLASEYASTDVTTKSSQEAPKDDVVTGMVDSSKNTSSGVWVNAKAGYEYIVVPAGTTETGVSEKQWADNGKKAVSDGELILNRAYNAANENDKNIRPVTKYEVLVRKPGSDTLMPSASRRSDITATKPVTPVLADVLNNIDDGISLDYATGNVIINGNTYEVYVPADGNTVPQYGTDATISNDSQSTSFIPAAKGGKKIYVRQKKNTDGIIPASDWLAVEVKLLENHKHDFGATKENPEGWEIIKEATCDGTGIHKHTCKTCGFAEKQEIAALGHDFDANDTNSKFIWKAVTDENGIVSGYKADAKLICKRSAAHILDAGNADVTSVINEATPTSEGSITYKAQLTYDGKEYPAAKTTKLAKLTKLDDGSQTDNGIYTSVSRADNAPDVKIDGIDIDMAKGMLSDSELKDYNDSSIISDIMLYLEVQNLNNGINSAEKTKIQEKINEIKKNKKASKTGVQYMDLSMYKRVKTKNTDGSEQITTSKLDTLNKNITVSVSTDKLIKAVGSGYERSYYVVRVHGDDVSVIDTKQSGDILSFETDRFSTYAIVYADVKKAASTTKFTISNVEKRKNSVKLSSKLKAKQSLKDITVTWGYLSGADGYKVYIKYCGSNFNKKLFKEIKNRKKTKATLSSINKKKIDTAKNYKIYVEAYKKVNGKKVSIGQTIIIHIAGMTNKAFTNVSKISLKKSSYTLKTGKTVVIKGKVVVANKKKKLLSDKHTSELRYMSSDTKIAKVSKTGKITAVKKGKCSVYVYARNGCAKEIKVVVK